MKRKLSALLAIVLVVVMVFPTAVFVGADGAATSTYTVYRDKGADTEADLTKGGTIDLAVDQTAEITIDTTETVTYDDGKNFAIDITASNSNKTLKLKGKYADETATLVISIGTSDKVSIKLACHEPKVVADTVKVESITYKSGEEEKTSTDFVFDAGDVVTGAKVSAKLDNGTPVETTNVTFSGSEKVTLKQSDNASDLAVSYTFDSVNDTTTKTGTKNVRIFVNGYDVSSVRVDEPTAPQKHSSTSITTADFESQYLTVYATIGGREWGVPSGYEVEYFTSSTATTKSTVTKIDNTNRNTLYFEVVYENVRSDRKAVSKYIDFNLPTPGNATVTLAHPSSDTYIVGEKLTKDEVEFKFEGISEGDVVTVSNIEFTPFVYGQTVVYVSFTANGKNYNNVEINFNGIATVEEKQVESIEVTGFTKEYKAGSTLDLSNLSIKVIYNNGTDKTIKHNSDGVVCTPAHGEKLAEGENKQFQVSYTENGVTKYYKDTYTVTASSDITSATLAYSSDGKKQYYVGETFNCSGYLVNITRGGKTTTYELSKLKTSDLPTFTSKDVGSNIKFTINVGVTSSDTKVPLEITGITVKNRSEISSISVEYIGDNKMDSETSKYKFMLGETPAVEDFEINVVYKDGSKAVRRINSENVNVTSTSSTAELEAKKSSATATLEDEGLKITFTITPTKIAEDTTSLKIIYTEKATTAINGKYYTDTEYVNFPIAVTIPECIVSYYTSSSYSSTVSYPYEDFYEALTKVVNEHADKAYRGVTVTLYKDVELKYQVTVDDSLTIDLNGHNIQLSSHSVLRVYSKSSYSNVAITFENSSKDDARICYTKDDDEDIILGYNDTFIIDKDTDSDVGKYDVTISSVKNGTVTGPKEISHGHDAQFEVKPADGYTVGSISVKQGTSKKTYTKDKDNENIFTVADVQGDLTITVTFEEKAWDNPFTDVYKSATYYKSIQFVYENGLFSGMSATKFEPDTTMTRAMFVTVLGRLADVDTSKYTKAPDFTDVSTTDASISYAIPYIQWAVENGLIEGYGNGKFGPKDNITHIQMYVLMQRYASYIEKKNTSATTTTIAANDVSDIPTWTGAYEAVQYAAKYDFLITSSNRITPNGDAKRSELAMLLEKFCDKVLEWNK